MFIGLGAVLAVVALAIGLTTALGGGSDANAALTAAGCTDVTLPSQGQEHLSTAGPKEGFEYNSFPPTSGPHDSAWALWNIYDRPVQQVKVVHNLEHGGIVVQYGDEVPQATVDQIRAWYLEDPTALLVAPLPALGDKVAMTAWTHLATCPTFDEKAADAFRDAHILEGPERFPAERLQPNM